MKQNSIRTQARSSGRATSPLRYPGGKTSLYPLVTSLLRDNKLERRHYAEPFAGGCGLALALLYGGHVSDIHINDVDSSIWAFWHSVLNHVEEIVNMIASTPVTVDEWRHQRAIYLAQDERDSLALGFAAFFLNRTNRSGIIKNAGVIGGVQQDGPYKIDCRFNRENLIRRVRRVAKYRSRIHLTKYDALKFLDKVCRDLSAETFFCIDPPYLKKGASLYTNYYSQRDHRDLAAKVLSIQNPWVITYDDDPFISDLYRNRRQYTFDIGYSLETKRQATELLIAGKGLRIPSDIRSWQVNVSRRKVA